ncbi:hypothetical protein [Geminicoccus sp.]|jgi:hypothetical protein|uniref:hypothetical protein n=1 Tax=Geminicoccus sp. TaxID=2024832 RepID=UPI002E36287E|nr:hypothetical protein [Geminicoccus sp.]
MAWSWLAPDHRAAQARAIRGQGSGQPQAHLPADEEARPAARQAIPAVAISKPMMQVVTLRSNILGVRLLERRVRAGPDDRLGRAALGAIRAPLPIQWLSGNGSAHAAAKTIELATALGFVPCFTPSRAQGAEAFVMSFKRGDGRVNSVSDEVTAVAALEKWMAEYNEVYPHSRLGYSAPGASRRATCQPAAFPIWRGQRHLIGNLGNLLLI